MTVTGIARVSSKIWVMPSFVPRMPLTSAMSLQLDLDVDAGRQVQALQLLDRLRRGVDDVDEPLVREHLEVLAAVLVLVRRADDRVDRPLGGQRHGSHDLGAGARHVLDDLSSRDVQHPVVVGPELDADPGSGHCLRPSPLSRFSGYLMISVTRPAPTVRPPSRIAKRRPSSIAIGAPRLTVIWMLSPGMTISTPSGRLAVPVTSVVRK